MCLTLPARITALQNGLATVDFQGKLQTVKIGTSQELSVGDWVLTTGDFLIKKIDQEEANEIADLLRSYPTAKRSDLPDQLRLSLEKAVAGNLELKDIEYILGLEDEKDLSALFAEANVTRKANIKDHICVHGLIEFSNYCKNNCAYCGLRRDNQDKANYRLSAQEIISTSVSAVNERGYKMLVLQSGEDDHFTRAELVGILSEIKRQARCFIYLSIGDRSAEDYKAFKQAGANGVLYRFETSNPELFEQMHPGKTFADRLKMLETMKSLGYIISTGMIVGLPGQTLGDLAQDIDLIKKLGTFMPSFGPLIATKNTPLQSVKPVDIKLVLKVIAAIRLHLPSARIPVTTAMESLGGGEQAREACFMAGANSVMFNLTPDKYRENYHIYDNKYYDAEKRMEKWALFKGDLSYDMLEEELQMSV